MLAVVAVRPAVEGAVAHHGEIIGHEVAAELVALVHYRPQRAAVRLPGKAVRVAQARSEHPVRAARGVDLPDRRAPGLLLHAVLRHVAVRPDGDVEALAVGTGDEVLGPVVVARAGGQVDDLASLGLEASLPYPV